MDLRLAFTTDMPYGDQPVMVNCFHPGHQDDTASLAIYPDHLHCYGCGWHLGPKRAAEAIAAHCGGDVTRLLDASYVAPPPQRQVKDLRAEPMGYLELSEACIRLLLGDRMDALNWLRARGLSRATIERASLGHDGWRFVIPVQTRDFKVLTLRYRVDPFYADKTYQGPKYMGYKGRNGLLLYNEKLVDPETDWLVLCEGELDALRLWQECYVPEGGDEDEHNHEGEDKDEWSDYPAVTATNGASQMGKLPDLIRELFPHVRHIVIASDQDRAGHQAARDTALALQREGYIWERVFWDTGKDVTEYLQAGGTPELFLPHAERRGNMADIIRHLARSNLAHRGGAA